MKTTDLRKMSVDDLLSLRDQISKTLSTRVKTERRELEMRLSRLRNVNLSESEFSFSGEQGRSHGPVKYINPDDPTDIWGGRGRRPHWLVAAIKAGKKLSDFQMNDFGRFDRRKSRPNKKQRH
jgi:DNA-binding protein H-NS